METLVFIHWEEGNKGKILTARLTGSEVKRPLQQRSKDPRNGALRGIQKVEVKNVEWHALHLRRSLVRTLAPISV